MAEGYGIGMSAKPIDFVSGAMAFNQAAADEKLRQIKENKEQVSDNYKKVLEASSIKLLPELTGKVRDRYQKEIEDYRTDIMNKFKESNGKLTMQQQREIQDGFIDKQQSMLYDINGLKKIEEAQKLRLDPRYDGVYDNRIIDEAIIEAQKNIEEGRGIGSDFTAKIASALIPQSNSNYFAKHYGNLVKGLNTEVSAALRGGILTSTQKSGLSVEDQESYDKANWAVENALETNPFYKNQFTDANGNVNTEARARVRKEIVDSISPIDTQQTQARYQSSGGRGSNPYSSMIDYTPKSFKYGDKTYDNFVQIRGDKSQTDRNFFIDNAVNLDTGEKSQLTEDNAKIVGFDVNKGVLLLKGKGGIALKAGKPVFIDEEKSPAKMDGVWKGKTENEMTPAWQETIVRGGYEGTKDIEGVENVSMNKDDNGNIVVTGTVLVDKKLPFTGNEKIKVKKVFKTFTDPLAEATYEAQLYENKEAATPFLRTMAVNGKPLEKYFDEYKPGEQKPAENKTTTNKYGI